MGMITQSGFLPFISIFFPFYYKHIWRGMERKVARDGLRTGSTACSTVSFPTRGGIWPREDVSKVSALWTNPNSTQKIGKRKTVIPRYVQLGLEKILSLRVKKSREIYRQGDGKGRSLARLAFDRNPAMMRQDNVLDDSQAQPCSAQFLGPGFIDDIKPLKNPA